MSECWFAVYTQPRAEVIAVENLLRQGFQVFFPRYLKARTHARRTDVVPSPLFPRYIFTAFDIEVMRWNAVRSTRGVVDLVRNNSQPIPVANYIIDEVRRREDNNGFVNLALHLKLSRGDKIKIDAGPFTSCEAIFETTRDNERVIALLSMLGREVPINIPAASLVPVD